MKKDEVWQKIKEDQTKIYNQSMLDVFLQTANELELRHYLELNDKQKEFVHKNTSTIRKLFHASVKYGDLDIIKNFMKKGAIDYISALYVAARNQKWDSAEVIINYALNYADPTNLMGFLDTLNASKEKDYLNKFLEKGLRDLLSTDKLYPKQKELAELLIKKGANTEQALYNNINFENADIVNFLIDQGADPDHALLYAASVAQPFIVQLTIEKGAKKIDEALRKVLFRYNRETANIYPDHQTLSICKATVSVLLRNGANIEDALLWASEYNAPFVVSLLINKGAKNLEKSLELIKDKPDKQYEIVRKTLQDAIDKK